MFNEEQLRRNLLEAKRYRDLLDNYIEAHQLLLSISISNEKDAENEKPSWRPFTFEPPLGTTEQEEEERETMAAVFRSIAPEQEEQATPRKKTWEREETITEIVKRPEGYRHQVEERPQKPPRQRRLRFPRLSDLKRDILDQMRDGGVYDPGELYTRMNGYSREEIRHALVWLKNQGFVDRLGRGSYILLPASLRDPRLQPPAAPQKKKDYWTEFPERDAQIEALAQDGWSTMEIAREFDLSRARIGQILRERGFQFGVQL